MDNLLSKITVANLLKGRDRFVKKINDRFPSLAQNIYLICFGVYLFSTFIKSTDMITYVFSQRQIYLLALFPTIIVIFKIFLFDKNSPNDLLMFSLLECLLFNLAHNAANVNIFYFGFFIYGAKNVDFKKIIKMFLFINLFGTALSMLLAFTGIIPNYAALRSTYSPVRRYSLGAIYPTNLAARFFSILMAYAALKKFKLSIPEYISFFAVAIWTYVVTDTRLDLILTLLLISAIMFYKPISKLLSKISYKNVVLLCFAYIAIILLLGFLYLIMPHNPIINLANNLLSGRLNYEAHAISHYSLKPFGQFIYQPGNGAFYIDSIYFRIPLMYGIPMILIFIALLITLVKALHVKPVFYLELCLLMFIISGGIDQHFFESCYNFILPALFATIPNKRRLKLGSEFYEN